MIWGFLFAVFVIWGFLKTAQAAGDRVNGGDWGRLAIAGVALAAPLLFAILWGIN